MAALIDFSKYNHDQLTVHSDTYYPLVIVMVSNIIISNKYRRSIDNNSNSHNSKTL